MIAHLISRRVAIEFGLSHYFTGLPCCRKHIDIRYSKNGNCVSCHRIKMRDRYASDPLFHAEISRINSQKHLQKKREYMARYRTNFPEKTRESQRKHYQANRDEMIARVKRRSKLEGFFSKQDIVNMMRSQFSRCFWCSTNISKRYHVDHIVPIKLGGTNWPSNLMLLCPACNTSKGAMHPASWAALPKNLKVRGNDQ